MGCAPAGVGSMIASLRFPSPAGGSPSKTVTPRPSGPRWIIESVIASSSAGLARPTVPQIPHMLSFSRAWESRDENVNNTTGSVSVPPRGRSEWPGDLAEQTRDVLDPLHVEPEEAIRPSLDRDRPLGRLTQGEARHAQEGRLLLHAAGVGDDGRRSRLQRQEVEVAHWVDQKQPVVEGLRADAGPRPRMHREDDRQLPAQALEARERAVEQRPIHEPRTVERDEGVRAALEAKSTMDVGALQRRPQPDEAVDHRVADEMNSLRRNALPQQVVLGLRAVSETPVGDLVDEHPVDLLGHRPIEAAQAGLDVRERELELRRGERSGQRGVHVAGDHDHGRPLALKDRFQPLERATRLHPVAAGPDGEVVVRLWQAELLEEDV